VLFLIGPVLTVQAFSGAFLNAAGRPEIVLRFRLITTVVNVVGFAIAVPFGIVAVAAAFVVRGYLLLPLNLYWMHRYVGVPVGAYLRQLRGVAGATLIMSASIVAVKVAVGSRADPPLLLLAEVLIAGLVYASVLWMLERDLVRDLLGVLQQALPSGLRRLFRS